MVERRWVKKSCVVNFVFWHWWLYPLVDKSWDCGECFFWVTTELLVLLFKKCSFKFKFTVKFSSLDNKVVNVTFLWSNFILPEKFVVQENVRKKVHPVVATTLLSWESVRTLLFVCSWITAVEKNVVHANFSPDAITFVVCLQQMSVACFWYLVLDVSLR